jgi:glycosyltransferase involved in cell wall biosynthesis
MKLTVIIPAYNASSTIQDLLDSFLEQDYKDFEVVVIDDCSQDDTPRLLEASSAKTLFLDQNQGPAFCRNTGASMALGDILVFTDSDCRVEKDWLKNISTRFADDKTDAVMGRLLIDASTFLGDSISSLGFPAGGSIGFDRIWKVDPEGYTHSLSTCNFAIKKNVFDKIGGFDTSFPYPGGEDSLLAYQLVKADFKIKYCPEVITYHGARKSFRDFIKWQFRRGISSFIFSGKISQQKDFLSLRFWSTKNIIKDRCRDRKFPLILFLLFVSVSMQSAGFLFGKYKKMSKG